MELRRHIPVHRASRVVLELGGYEFACCLGRMVPTNARLRLVFQLFERDALEVQEWLKHLNLSRKTKQNIKGVFHRMMELVMLWGLLSAQETP
jgi:hypothetical protein